MTNIQSFIEDAIKGGWKPYFPAVGQFTVHNQNHPIKVKKEEYCVYEVILDPSAWQAVGKTRGWTTDYSCRVCHGCGMSYSRNGQDFPPRLEYWINHYMMLFVNLLIEGKDIESALGEIQ